MKRIIAIVFALATMMSAIADIQVSDVKVFSGYPWKEVMVGYTITGTIDDIRSIDDIRGIELKATDEVANKTYTAKSVVGVETTPGRHIIRWNANADGVIFKSDKVVFDVNIVNYNLYLVIDLSGGKDVEAYPVSWLWKVPKEGWTDEYKTTKLVLRWIEAGSFVMGGSSRDYPGASDSGLHSVTISKPFYMGVFEVTQRQWELVMGNRPSYFKNDSCYMSRPVERVSYNMIRGSSSGSRWPSSPAVDADSFMGKIRAKTGLSFDLPTEAQWEYACRAGTTTALNSGKNLTDRYECANLAEVGRYKYNGGASFGSSSSSCDLSAGTAAVGSYKPNAWGLYDMHGNVWEWCLDWYISHFGSSAVTDPKGASSDNLRAVRGGAWHCDASLCRSAGRMGDGPPNLEGYGFRLSCSTGL